MKKHITLLLPLSILFCNNPISAMQPQQGGPDNGSAGWIGMCKGICQLIGVAWVVGGLHDIEKKSKDPEITQENYDLRKFGLLTLSGFIASSFHDDWQNNIRRWALFSSLLGLTHITANNRNVIHTLQSIPFVGPLLTDPVDKNGNEKGSVGKMIRYITTYMAYRTVAKTVFPGLNNYLFV